MRLSGGGVADPEADKTAMPRCAVYAGAVTLQ